MAPNTTPGIYRYLPTFDPSLTGLKAITTGTNGISGFRSMRILLGSPARWSKFFVLPWKPLPQEMMALLTEKQRDRIQHVAADFLKETEDIAKAIFDADVNIITFSSTRTSSLHLADGGLAKMGTMSE